MWKVTYSSNSLVIRAMVMTFNHEVCYDIMNRKKYFFWQSGQKMWFTNWFCTVFETSKMPPFYIQIIENLCMHCDSYRFIKKHFYAGELAKIVVYFFQFKMCEKWYFSSNSLVIRGLVITFYHKVCYGIMNRKKYFFWKSGQKMWFTNWFCTVLKTS